MTSVRLVAGVGQDSLAIEVVGKPYDLQQIILAAVPQAKPS